MKFNESRHNKLTCRQGFDIVPKFSNGSHYFKVRWQYSCLSYYLYQVQVREKCNIALVVVNQAFYFCFRNWYVKSYYLTWTKQPLVLVRTVFYFIEPEIYINSTINMNIVSAPWNSDSRYWILVRYRNLACQ